MLKIKIKRMSFVLKHNHTMSIKYLLCLNLQIKMSKATKRKHVTKEIEDLTVPTETQLIVRIIQSRGNNLHEVVDPTGSQYLVSMPMKFRRNIWVKRGDFVVVEPIAEGDKVKAEIVKILTRVCLIVNTYLCIKLLLFEK